MVCNALVAGGRLLGVSGMRESAPAASLIPDTQPAALHLTADHQQPRHYTPYAVITQV